MVQLEKMCNGPALEEGRCSRRQGGGGYDRFDVMVNVNAL